MHLFDKKLPAAVEEEQLLKNNSELSIDDVAVWIESNKGLEGRFCWFETLARETNFYQKIARRLLSIGTVGSIDVERRAKGLKHEILSKARNRLSDDQAIILYGMSENLHHLHKASVEMMDKIQDSAGQYFPN